jgi:hypothetical protein
LHQQVKAVRDNDNLPPMEKRNEMRELIMANSGAFRIVLTPDQLSTYENICKQRFGRS